MKCITVPEAISDTRSTTTAKMIRIKVSIVFLVWILQVSVAQNIFSQPAAVTIYPDSIVNDISNRPIGINLNFFMDGGRFPNAKHPVKDALNRMGVKYLRYPGGEKSDLYLFSTAPYLQSNPSLSRSVGVDDYPGMTNDTNLVYDPLDFDEFISICKELKAEPILVVAADHYLIPNEDGKKLSTKAQLIEHATEWVRYANIKKKYGIKYWMIGNESWNSNNKNSTAEIYAHDVVEFSKAMKDVDPGILIIPNGHSDGFFKTVIQVAGDHIDRLCVSNYGVERFYRGYKTYEDTMQVLIKPAIRAINAMKKYASAEQLKKFKMIVAEYGSIDWANHWPGTNDMGHAIVTFDMTGQLLVRNEVEFSCFWNTRWIDNEKNPGVDHDALDMDGNLNPTGEALRIWSNHMGRKMVETASTSPIISYCSFDEDSAYVYLVNKTGISSKVKINIPGRNFESTSKIEYYGTSPADRKPVWRTNTVKPRNETVTLKPYSITVIKLKILKSTR